MNRANAANTRKFSFLSGCLSGFFATAMLLPLTLLQGQSIWSGKGIGKQNDWMDTRNWEQHRLPDTWDKVILPYRPGNLNEPVFIRNRSIKIAALEMQSGSRLEISKGSQLIIDGSDIYDYGILLLGGTLVNEGEIIIINAALSSVEKLNGVLINRGVIRVQLAGELLEKTGASQTNHY